VWRGTRLARIAAIVRRRFDLVEAFVSAAEQAGSADEYRVATASNSPFSDKTFDLAIAYNVLMDIEDVPMALREIVAGSAPHGNSRHLHRTSLC
jgi:hypothetical protein